MEESEHQSSSQLAEAGFFYTGQDDYVKCFFCGGGLVKWKEEDIPWIEHGFYFNQCQFVIIEKGLEFIEECKRKKKQVID